MSGKINPTFENYKGDILAFITSIFYVLFLLTVLKIRDKVSALSIIFISGFGEGITLFLIIYSYFLFNELLNLQEVLGMGIILIGIYIAKKNY